MQVDYTAYGQQTESHNFSQWEPSRLKDYGKSTNRGINRLTKWASRLIKEVSRLIGKGQSTKIGYSRQTESAQLF